MTELAILGVVGGILALDATSVGQFMVSRPLVSGAITGWLVGDPAAGFMIGSVLEIYLLVSFPSGGSRFPDGTTAAVVAVAAAGSVSSAGALPLAIAFGLVWGRFGGWTVMEFRKLNGRLVPEPGDADADSGRVVRAQLGGTALDFARGAVVTVAGAAAGRGAIAALVDAWPLGHDASVGVVLVGGAASVGILLHDIGGFRVHRIAFVAGLALGLLGARFL